MGVDHDAGVVVARDLDHGAHAGVEIGVGPAVGPAPVHGRGEVSQLHTAGGIGNGRGVVGAAFPRAVAHGQQDGAVEPREGFADEEIGSGLRDDAVERGVIVDHKLGSVGPDCGGDGKEQDEGGKPGGLHAGEQAAVGGEFQQGRRRRLVRGRHRRRGAKGMGDILWGPRSGKGSTLLVNRAGESRRAIFLAGLFRWYQQELAGPRSIRQGENTRAISDSRMPDQGGTSNRAQESPVGRPLAETTAARERC